jgi:hypothetical protein
LRAQASAIWTAKRFHWHGQPQPLAEDFAQIEDMKLVDEKRLIIILIQHIIYRGIAYLHNRVELFLQIELHIDIRWLQATPASRPDSGPQPAGYEDPLAGAHQLDRTSERPEWLQILVEISDLFAQVELPLCTCRPFEQLGNIVLHVSYPVRTYC